MDSGNRRPFDADHVSEWLASGEPVKTPGKARYSKALIVLPADFVPVAGVPRTRGDCPTKRPCPHVRCEWNLWMIDGRDTPGRRWGDKARPSQVIAHTLFNCGADIAERMKGGRMEVGEVADALNISDRQVRRIVDKALTKLASIPEARELLQDIAQAGDATGWDCASNVGKR